MSYKLICSQNIKAPLFPETPTLSSKLCTNPKNAYLCDLLDYTNTTRICSMKPTQCIEISDWVSCAGGLPLGSSEQSPVTDLDVDVLFECEMEPHEGSSHQDIITVRIPFLNYFYCKLAFLFNLLKHLCFHYFLTDSPTG